MLLDEFRMVLLPTRKLTTLENGLMRLDVAVFDFVVCVARASGLVSKSYK